MNCSCCCCSTEWKLWISRLNLKFALFWYVWNYFQDSTSEDVKWKEDIIILAYYLPIIAQCFRHWDVFPTPEFISESQQENDHQVFRVNLSKSFYFQQQLNVHFISYRPMAFISILTIWNVTFSHFISRISINLSSFHLSIEPSNFPHSTTKSNNYSFTYNSIDSGSYNAEVIYWNDSFIIKLKFYYRKSMKWKKVA